MRSATPLSLLFAPLCLLGLMGCPEDVDEADPDASDKVVIPAFENAIVASDQLPDDLTIITVERVDLDAPGYIVVREALPASPDLPGKTIAVAPIQRSASNLKVALDRPAVPGERLFATLHVESNDNDSFNFDQTPGIDPPALDILGLPASASFSINLPPPGAITVEDQGVMARVWADEVIISSVTSPQRRSLLALHTSLDDLTRPVGVVALSTFSSEQVPVTLNAPVPHNTELFAVLHQDLGAQESFDADLDLPILQDAAPIAVSFTVTLDPTPSASISCTPTTLCTRPSSTLPFNIAFDADHDGELLVRYTDTTGEAREALYPVSALDTSTSNLMLPTAACDTAFEVSLLVSVDGVDPLTAPTLPFATNADGAPVTCTVAEQPADLVSDIIVDPADTLSLTSTIAGFSLLRNASAFITVSSVDAMVEPTDPIFDAELLGVIQQTERVQDLTVQLNRPLVQGELVLITAHDDQNTTGVFDDRDQVILAFGENPEPEEGEMQRSPVYLQSSHVIDIVGTSEPFLTVADEPAADTTRLNVTQSVAQGAALIVVFNDGGGRPGEPLGFGAVPAGVNQDISVTLSRDTIAAETLYVLLLDDDGNQIYDDIFTDPVFVRDAAPVMQVVTVGGAQ